MEFSFTYSTPQADIRISLTAKPALCEELIKYQKKAHFDELCKKSCPNYDSNWSCPPNSPSYETYAGKYKNCLLLLATCDLAQFGWLKSDNLRVRTANSRLKSFSNRLLKYLENSLDGMMLSTGICRRCKQCTKRSSGELGCKKPQEMRYSLQTLGLNVAQVSEDWFKHKLLWQSNQTSPAYSSVVSGILTNDELPANKLASLIEQYQSTL